MRRLDWFLAAIVASFLVGAVVIEANALSFGARGLMRAQAYGAGEISLKRLVSHMPQPPMLPGDAR